VCFLGGGARDARYGFGAGARSGEFLLTAHQEDDQLETVCCNCFAVPEWRVLAAMPDIAPFAGVGLRGRCCRVRGPSWKSGCAARIELVDDDTNADETLDRNYCEGGCFR